MVWSIILRESLRGSKNDLRRRNYEQKFVKLNRIENDLERQYLQSKIQQLVISIFKSEIHLPSAAKEWHIPQLAALPIPSLVFFLSLPLDEQDASYLAASERITNFSFNVIFLHH